jgi:hypothetical protein
MITAKNLIKLTSESEDPIEVSSNLLLLFAEVITDCPTCKAKLQASRVVSK